MGRTRGSFGQPSYRLHKSTGRAVVTLDCKDHYLGAHGSPESRQKYDRLIAEWLLRGRQAPCPDSVVTMGQVIAGYVDHLRQENGRGPDDQQVMALRWLRSHYGDTLAKDFGALPLKALRLKMCASPSMTFGKRQGHTLSRRYVNHLTQHIKHAIRWATECAMIPANVWFSVQAVMPLRAGKSPARDTAPVRPVEQKHVEAVLEVASPVLGAMIRLQLLTGMRCGEVFQMRGCDIDTATGGATWRYRPQTHKTQHHGRERVIPLGPEAQEIIRPFLKPDVTAYLFSPTEGDMNRTVVRRLKDGKLHVYAQRLVRPARKKRNAKYSVASYATAIKSAIRKADRLAHERRPDVASDVPIVKRWHSHQLRHNAATYIRQQFGLDAARAVLGHSSQTMTEVYAEQDWSIAEKVMAKVG